MSWSKKGKFTYYKESTTPNIALNGGDLTGHENGTTAGLGADASIYNRVTFSKDIDISALSYMKHDTTTMTGNIRIYEQATGTLLASGTGTANSGASGTIVKETLTTPVSLKADTEYNIGFYFPDSAQVRATGTTNPHTHTGTELSFTHNGHLSSAGDAHSTSSGGAYEWIIRYHYDTKVGSIDGDLWYDTTNNTINFCNGSSWVAM